MWNKNLNKVISTASSLDVSSTELIEDSSGVSNSTERTTKGKKFQAFFHIFLHMICERSVSISSEIYFRITCIYAIFLALVMEETTIATINSTSNDKNGLTLSTSLAPITTSTARSSTTSKVASSTAIITTEVTEHQGTSTTAHLTDVSLQTQTSTKPITVRFAKKR